MLPHKKIIKTNGPTLLWILLKTYCTAAHVIRSTMRKLDIPSETLLVYKYNVGKFCDYGIKTLSTLADVGGDDSQQFEKFYDALKAMPNIEFNNVLIV